MFKWATKFACVLSRSQTDKYWYTGPMGGISIWVYLSDTLMVLKEPLGLNRPSSDIKHSAYVIFCAWLEMYISMEIGLTSPWKKRFACLWKFQLGCCKHLNPLFFFLGFQLFGSIGEIGLNTRCLILRLWLINSRIRRFVFDCIRMRRVSGTGGIVWR